MDGKQLTLGTLFALISLLLVFLPISSQQGGGTYDPWIDTNDDGIIDVNDLQALAFIYGTAGEPINKTDLLLELQSRVGSLNASFVGLEARVSQLEEQSVPPGYIGPPAYDSGWVTLGWGETVFTHNLDTTEVLVYMLGWTDAGGIGVHQYLYGGDTRRVDPITYQYGAYWRELSSTTIKVHRLPHDYLWQQVRVMIWKIDEP